MYAKSQSHDFKSICLMVTRVKHLASVFTKLEVDNVYRLINPTFDQTLGGGDKTT